MGIAAPVESFLTQLVPAYPSLEDVLKLLSDGISADYKQFNKLMTNAHTTMVQFKHRGVVWNLWRLSTMRGTPGFDRFKYGIFHEYESEAELNDPNVKFRCYIDDWLDWQTINLATS